MTARTAHLRATTTCDICGKVGPIGGMKNHAKTCGNDEYRHQRFWPKVKIGLLTECWEWLGAKNVWGYGTFAWGSGRNVNASRAAWLLTKGAIPEGQDVLHTCNNKLCCNSRHMYLGTDVENSRDRIEAGTQGIGTSHRVGPDIAEQIRKRRAEGAKFRELCREFGISHTTVSMILNGRSYKP